MVGVWSRWASGDLIGGAVSGDAAVLLQIVYTS